MTGLREKGPGRSNGYFNSPFSAGDALKRTLTNDEGRLIREQERERERQTERKCPLAATSHQPHVQERARTVADALGCFRTSRDIMMT